MRENIFHNYYGFIILIILNQVRIFFCQNCRNVNSLENSICFNNILFINTSSYRAGHFAKNKNGELIVEYSNTEQRLFYGLNKNGNYYNESDFPFKEKILQGFLIEMHCTKEDMNHIIYLWQQIMILIKQKNIC